MLRIDEETVRRLLPMGKAIGLLEEAFQAWSEGRAQNQTRRRLFLPSGAVLHAMAGSDERYFGTKIYSTHPKHGAWFHMMLYDANTAEPLALLDANWLGQIRTGAATGLATSRLSREDAKTLAVIGSGFQARSQVDAVRAVRGIDCIQVFSRNEDRAKVFANEYGGKVAISADAAVSDADIVITATNAKEPVFRAECIRPGTHINAVGSNSPVRRELPGELLTIADRIVADSVEQAYQEAGDLLLGLELQDWSKVEELRFAGPRLAPDQVTVFKSVGLGLEDVAAAGYVYEQLRLGN
jgi:ornithine cyclodeaminase/alanine dehydrogenase-like protein (mu-crystallin family)